MTTNDWTGEATVMGSGGHTLVQQEASSVPALLRALADTLEKIPGMDKIDEWTHLTHSMIGLDTLLDPTTQQWIATALMVLPTPS